ncbi:MAG: Xaa-Pro peptidase family protein [Candidatus Bathyarchaeia archaeon]|nr:aminopeptidase P family protein [Candidatus Bathyarchaeota archaeon]
MLQDIDKEMEKRGLEAVVAFADSTYSNHEFHYLVGTSIPRGGVYLKKLFEPPLLIVNSIDLIEAKKGNVKNIKTFSDYKYEEILKSHGAEKAFLIFLKKILEEHKVSGRIILAGKNEASKILRITEALKNFGYQIVIEKTPTLLESLMETKSIEEIEKIKNASRKTEEIMKKTIEFISNLKVLGNYLLYKGKKATVKNVKLYVKQLLIDEELILSEDFILATGVKSAQPHYLGSDKDFLILNKPIVFDLFPQEKHGYFTDITRTIVVGRASKKIKEMHQLVLEAQEKAIEKIKEGVKGKEVMNTVCDFFEKKGYSTIKSSFKVEKGFIHSLGHGIGLTIGEHPFLSIFSEDELKKGNVFTIEPGLYNQKIGGVRVEDVFIINFKAKIEPLTKLSKNLEV